MASGCECTEEAVEAVADGDATGFEVAPGEVLFAGAAMTAFADGSVTGEVGQEIWRGGSER